MDISSKAGIGPLNYDGATTKEVTTKVTRDKNDKVSSIYVFSTLELPTQVNLPKSDTQNSARSIVDRDIEAYAQASTSNEAAQSDCSDSFKAQKRPFTDDSGTISQLCKSMKGEAMAISTGRDNLEPFAESLVKVITDPESTDADTSEAARLISEYGADELAKLTVPFSYHTNITRHYPAITLFALACRFGKLDLVKALYVNQQQLNQAFDMENGVNGRTALMLAVNHGHADVVKQLLDLGADPQILDENNRCADELNSVFNRSRQDTYIKIRELLVDYRKEKNLPPYKEPAADGYYIEDTGEMGITINFPAALSEHPEIFEQYLSENPGCLMQIGRESPEFLIYLLTTQPKALEKFFSENPGFVSRLRREAPELLEHLFSENPNLLESLSSE
ncbi:ankyrin repeat domain-containing protein [Endozoicomonas sp. 2B-B]